MQQKSKIAFCVPTKDRISCIKELLSDIPRINAICEMDVYIYDSSVSDDVERCVNSHNKLYNIIYKRVGEYKDLNGKVYKGTDQAALKLYDIYFEIAEKQMYDYVWVCGDGIRFSDNIYREINKLEKDFDFVSIVVDNLNEYVYKKRQDVVWYNPEEYLKYNTGMNTLFGGVLVNTRAIKYVDFNDVSKWYKDTCYLSYAYIRLYAEMAMKSPKFKSISIFDDNGIKCSKYKLDSGWRDDFFDIFYECFINVVNSFPIDNEYKEFIIEDFYKKNIMFDEFMLEYMRWRGGFDYKILNKWRKYIECAIPYETAKKIADIPQGLIIEKATNLKNEFINFIEEHKQLYIYGAGYYGARYQAIVEHNGYKIDGFIVTNKANNPDYIDGYKVYVYDEIKNDIKNAGIILGLDENNARQVRENIEKYVTPDNIYENSKYQLYIY